MKPDPAKSPARLLIVDDDPGLRRLMEKALRRAGHETAAAGTAAEAMDWLKTAEADLILLDLHLPDGHGSELADRLMTRSPQVPFLVITGQGDERVAVNMMKRGATDYVVKDAEFLEFLPALVEKALAQIHTTRRLSAAEEQLRLIKKAVDQAQDAILVANAAGPAPRIVYANTALCALTGIDPATAEGSLLESLDPAATVCFRRALANRRALAGENTVNLPGGGSRTLECKIAPVKDTSGAITHWVSIQRDITERKKTEKELSARVRQQAAVATLGHRVLSGIAFEALLQEAALLLVETLDANFSKVLEFLPDGETLLLRAGAGWRPGYVGRLKLAAKRLPSALALETGEPVFFHNLQDDPRFEPQEFFKQHGVASGMSVPIRDRGRPFGVLGVETRAKREFTGDDIHFLQAIANVISDAIERRRAEKELLEAAAREQQRIGQDLHDGLGQQLAGIELLTHVLEEDLEDVSPDLAAKASKITSLVRESITQTRQLARGLSPVQVEADGLMAALEQLAAGIRGVFPVSCEFTCDKPVLFPDNQVATHLYRIAQEAANNAIKHGKADEVRISLSETTGHRVLEIRDNGRGFAPDKDAYGLGLRIMRRRAAFIGGDLEILPARPRGTRVVCTITG